MTADGKAPALTVVIPTRNRPSRVTDCVNALLHSTTGQQERVEIIVVDNGSTEDSAARIATLAAAGRGVQVITDAHAGAARARNLGLARARSELVAFIDDDVLVEPGWLDAVRARFVDPAVVGVIGRIALTMERERPRWLTTDLETWYSALDYGDEDHELAPGQPGWSANLTVRRDAALSIGGFNEHFGPGRRVRYNEDIDFVFRLRSAGTIWYAAGACAVHRVDKERLTRRWLLRRTYLQGRSNAALVRSIGSARSEPLPFASFGYLDAVAKRWWCTLRACRGRATRQSVLLRDATRRAEALGFAWERTRAALVREH